MTITHNNRWLWLVALFLIGWLIILKLLLLACFIFAGLELLALALLVLTFLRPASAGFGPSLGLLWTFFGSSTGPLRASFGPCFLPLAFLRPLCLLAFSLLDLFF